MADSIFAILSSCACKFLGVEGIDNVVGWLGQHLSDQGQRVTKALRESNEKAWRALEIALAGESLWNCFDRGEDRAFRQQLAAYLKSLPMPELHGKQDHRKKILQDIDEAKRKAVLFDRLSPEELRRRAGPMADRSDPQKVLTAERQALRDMAGVMKGLRLEALAWLLEQQPQPGQSVLVVAARYYFQRQVEDDEELARRLQFTAMENLTEAQAQGFRQLDEGLKANARRVEEILEDLRDLILNLRSEMEKMRGENRDLYARVLQALAGLQLDGRPLRPADSLSIRGDEERRLVKRLLAEYRALPEEQKRGRPALLNGLGKLQVAAGDYAGAQEAFTRVAEISPDEKARAEGHYNAYHAALERAAVESSSYQVALAELKMALRADPARFAPFPLADFEVERILGAGGFGVAFLCRRLGGDRVVVKSLNAECLDRDVAAVFQEAVVLQQVHHPCVIRLQHYGYADAANRSRPYLVMDYFEGLTLQEHVRRQGSLTPGDVRALAMQTAAALRAAHEQGVLHRDVKPANLLVRKNGSTWEVRLIDFGLAMRARSVRDTVSNADALARTLVGGSVAGTMDYAAPEQMGKLPGIAVGKYSDVYGFGRTCCFALFATPHPGRKHWQQMSDDGLSELLDACIAEQPNERPADFGAVLEKLVGKSRRLIPPPPPSEEIAWQTVQQNGTVQSYENHLKSYPQGRQAEEAQHHAARLLRDMLLHDMENVLLRKRYLAMRTPDLREGDLLRIPAFKSPLGCALQLTVLLFVLGWSAFFFPSPAVGFVVLATVILLGIGIWLWVLFRPPSLRRSFAALGPLPRDAFRHSVASARRRYLGE